MEHVQLQAVEDGSEIYHSDASAFSTNTTLLFSVSESSNMSG